MRSEREPGLIGAEDLRSTPDSGAREASDMTLTFRMLPADTQPFSTTGVTRSRCRGADALCAEHRCAEDNRQRKRGNAMRRKLAQIVSRFRFTANIGVDD
jgi:hypothetical protein